MPSGLPRCPSMGLVRKELSLSGACSLLAVMSSSSRCLCFNSSRPSVMLPPGFASKLLVEFGVKKPQVSGRSAMSCTVCFSSRLKMFDLINQLISEGKNSWDPEVEASPDGHRFPS